MNILTIQRISNSGIELERAWCGATTCKDRILGVGWVIVTSRRANEGEVGHCHGCF